MGAQQAYHWAALAPDAVERAIVVCGSARTSPHNQTSSLASLMAVLEAAPEHLGQGRFSAEPARRPPGLHPQLCRLGDEPGLVSRGASPQQHRRHDPRRVSRRSLGARFQPRRSRPLRPASYLVCRGHQRQCPLSRRPRGGARRHPRPRPADAGRRPTSISQWPTTRKNSAFLRSAGELRPIPSIWGHVAGAPANIPEDFAFLKAAVRAWLDR